MVGLQQQPGKHQEVLAFIHLIGRLQAAYETKTDRKATHRVAPNGLSWERKYYDSN